MTQNAQPTPNASRRHWLYGTNAILMAAIGIAIIGFLLYETATAHHAFDWTSSGMYSMSPSTKKMLGELDQKDQNYEFVSFYTAAGSEDAEEHQRRVNDLLTDYARLSKHVTVDDPHAMLRDTLDQKIRERYAAELKPYQQAVEDFPRVQQAITAFTTTEAAGLNGLLQPGSVDSASSQVTSQLYNFMKNRAPQLIDDIAAAVKKQRESVSPDWVAVIDEIKSPSETDESLPIITGTIAGLADPAALQKNLPADQKLSPALLDYLTKAQPRYKAAADILKAYVAEITKLQPLKVNVILRAIAPNSVVILGPSEAKVIPDTDIFKQEPTDPNDPNSPMGPETFVGEQAISSALLGMAHPDKVKVVMVTCTPMAMSTRGSQLNWSGIAAALKEQNFDVLDWCPTPAPTSPDQPPMPSTTPPAIGKGVVWIVFPPDPPTQQQMLSGQSPDSKSVDIALQQHMELGGSALLLAGANSAGPMSALTGGGGPYAYDDIAKSFGILVQPKYAIVESILDQDQQIVVQPRLELTRFEDHEITRPLQSLPTEFVGLPNQQSGDFFDAPTVVAVDPHLPAGVQAQVLLRTPNDSDHWGESAMTLDAVRTAKFDKDADYGAPCPMAAAAVRDLGDKDKERRLVVIGSPLIGADGITLHEVQAGNQRVQFSPFPGNTEFVKNSVLWLAGYENMISVTSRSTVALRIRDISPTFLTFLRIMLYIGIPVLVLITGGIVLAFRRR